MLSRIAENMYWIGRYVERAECTARLLNVNYLALAEAPLTRGGARHRHRAVGAAAEHHRQRGAVPVTLRTRRRRERVDLARHRPRQHRQRGLEPRLCPRERAHVARPHFQRDVGSAQPHLPVALRGTKRRARRRRPVRLLRERARRQLLVFRHRRRDPAAQPGLVLYPAGSVFRAGRQHHPHPAGSLPAGTGTKRR